MTIGLIDINSGNLKSLESAIKKLNIKYKICKKKEDFIDISKLILPGVGAFPDFMSRLKEKNLIKIIFEKCNNQIPFLGICVGFQVIFSKSYEHKETSGLNLIDGSLVHLKEKNIKIKTPHVGWNNCKILKKSPLFEGIHDNSDFYFDHSFYLKSKIKSAFLTKTSYDCEIISSVSQNNIYGVQFHPEKSQNNGLKCLKNFCEFC